MLIDPWRESKRYIWSERDLIWLRAAKTLPDWSRMAAYQEIAQMLGISVSKVNDRAKRLRRVKKSYSIAAE